MGAGKTVVGRALAQRLDFPFFDLDQEIERAEGKSVTQIFTDHGESYFRRREWEVLQTLHEGEMVLAVGGGAYTIDDNVNLINSRSTSIWLQCPIEVCLERCAATMNTRPLFSDPEEWTRLYQHRKKYYKRAKYHVDSGSGTPEEIADRIIGIIS